MHTFSTVHDFELNNRDIPADIHFMFVDTETTGVPENGYSDWSHCRLVQLGIVVKNRLFETVYESCLTVKYDGTNASTPEAYNVHGISENDRMNATPGYVVCEEFINVAQRCDVLISHGNAFDFGVIFRECLLYGFDISSLIGKTVANTKQSEHYRGFSENLSQTVLRLNPNWSLSTNNVDTETNHAHNALYDAHLCAELWRHSHHPSLNKPMQDLIEFLNYRRYSEGLHDIRVAIENYALSTNNDNEQMNPIDEPEEDYDDMAEPEEEETDDVSWREEYYSEEDIVDEFFEEDMGYSEYAYEDEPVSDDNTTTEDYLRSMCSSGLNLSYHAPEDSDA